jgi:hypothetical protein
MKFEVANSFGASGPESKEDRKRVRCNRLNYKRGCVRRLSSHVPYMEDGGGEERREI